MPSRLDRITTAPEICHGKPCLRGLRYPVTTILELFASGMSHDEILVILQTESPEGVDNAEAIYSLPGCDAIFVGPNDLQAQMRTPDGQDPSPEDFEAMLQRVLAAGKKTGCPVGLHTQTTEQVEMRIAQGWQFLAIGSELRFMTVEAQRLVTALKLGTAGDLARY